jgi:hypothetical protein
MGTVIRGRVIDPDGEPVAGARIYFRSGPGVHADIAGLTSEAGEFALFAPSPGRYEIESAVDDREPVATSVEVGTSDEAFVELQLGASDG